MSKETKQDAGKDKRMRFIPGGGVSAIWKEGATTAKDRSKSRRKNKAAKRARKK